MLTQCMRQLLMAALACQMSVDTVIGEARAQTIQPAEVRPVGVLVQTNYSGVLKVAGTPVGQELGRYYLGEAEQAYQSGGSIIVIIATDAPLSDRNLRRLARRAFIGVGNTGSSMSNGSGDYALAFATAETVRRTPARRRAATTVEDLPNDKISPLLPGRRRGDGGGGLQRDAPGHLDDRRQ